MKLRYRYDLDTCARDDTANLQSLIRHVNDCDVEFLFGNEHTLVAINVFVPNAKLTYNSEGKIEPLDKRNDEKAHVIAAYVANVLQEINGKCDIRKTPDTPEYIPETTKEKGELEGKTLTRTKSISLNCFIRNQYDYSEQTLNRYVKQVDAFAIYSDARRMSDSTGKYREFFRVLEYFFPFEGTKFDEEVATYLKKYDSKYDEKYIFNIRQLRNRCTHAKKDYISSNDLIGLEQVRNMLPEIQKMAKILLDNRQ